MVLQRDPMDDPMLNNVTPLVSRPTGGVNDERKNGADDGGDGQPE
jgi:hypothetical protein